MCGKNQTQRHMFGYFPSSGSIPLKRVKSGKFRLRHCFFHFWIIGMKIKSTKQTVKILMRRLIKSRIIWVLTVCKCVSNLPAVRSYLTTLLIKAYVRNEYCTHSSEISQCENQVFLIIRNYSIKERIRSLHEWILFLREVLIMKRDTIGENHYSF